jgi:hypothetical protein
VRGMAECAGWRARLALVEGMHVSEHCS